MAPCIIRHCYLITSFAADRLSKTSTAVMSYQKTYFEDIKYHTAHYLKRFLNAFIADMLVIIVLYIAEQSLRAHNFCIIRLASNFLRGLYYSQYSQARYTLHAYRYNRNLALVKR